MADILFIITNAGRAALINAANTGTNAVLIAQAGLSATAVVANPTMTTLPGEFKRIASLSGDTVADDTIHLIIRDESADAYTVRSIALYLDNGTLFGLYGQAASILDKTAQSLMLLGVDVKFGDINATAITFGDANFLNPPATTERVGVVELATSPETLTGTDTQRAITPKGFGDALGLTLNFRFGINNGGIWHPANDGAGSGMDADLLDGQQGSYYANIVARLGYTPVNKAGDTFTGDVTAPRILLTANGDGQAVKIGDDAWLGDVNISNGFRVTGVQNPDRGFICFGNADLAVLGRIGAGPLTYNGYALFHSGNDGAGSGMDADLLDGRDSSAYALVDGTAPFTGTIKAFTANALMMRPAAGSHSTIIHRHDGSQYYILVSAASAGPSDQWNDLRPFQINLASGRVQSSNGQDFYGGTAVRDALTLNGAGVWTSANDGAGSGLDADLLDGQDGSYYSNIVARLGYSPLNRAGDNATGRMTFSGNGSGNSSVGNPAGGLGEIEVRGNGAGGAFMALHRPGSYAAYFGLDTDNRLRFGGWSLGDAHLLWHSGNDGDGSGLDADMVDGWHRDSIRDWNNLLNKPWNWAGQGGQPSWVWGGNGNGDAFYVWNPANFSVNYASTAGHAGTAGYAGSAGNADTLDGFDGSNYQRIVAENLAENGGFTAYASGKVECWGFLDIARDSSGTFNLPYPHSEWVIPTISAYTPQGITTSEHNVDFTAIIGSPPTAIRFWNADDRNVRVWIQTKGK